MNVKIPEYIFEIAHKYNISEKLKKQLSKLEHDIFDSSLNFEKIKCKKGIYFYSFRVDIHFRAYMRSENGILVIFDVNHHDYKSIINKLKTMG